MSAHIVFTAWDEERPATLSPTVIDNVIRGRIGFDGLLLTDDIDMQALDGSIPDRSEKALAAGCDVVLNCWAKMDDQLGIAERLGAMSAETAGRLDRVHAMMGEPADCADTEELLAKRDALLAIAEATA